jgi:DNA-binding transcriptional regulator GbsR (MarR family)
MRNVPPELTELVNQVGNFIEYWGFKNVQGRIWAHLWLSSEPLDAADLMKRLDISKALVSISMKEMLEYEVVLEVGKSERGTLLYRANPDKEKVIMNVLRRRERMMMARISSAFKLLEKMNPIDKKYHRLSQDQMSQMGEMVGNVEFLLDSILAMEPDSKKVWQQLSQFSNFVKQA